MASYTKNGKNPEKESEEITIDIQNFQNLSYLPPQTPSAESPLIRRKSRLDETSVSIDATLEKLVAGEELEPETKEKSGPDESEIYQRVTDQLSAKSHKKTTIKLSFELSIFLLLLALLICSLTVNRFKGKKHNGVENWRWFVLLLVIFSGLLITDWVVRIIVFLIELKFMLKKNVVYFTHGLKDNVKVFIWLSLVLATWISVFRYSKSSKATRYIKLTLVALVVGSFLWIVKTACIKMLASSFHFNRYFKRINDAVFQHYVLQLLSGRPLYNLDSNGKTGETNARENVENQKRKIDWAKVQKMQQDKVPSYSTKLLADAIMNSRMTTMSDMLSKTVVDGGVELDDDKISSEEEATAMAYKIFCNILGVQPPDREHIDENDLLKFLKPDELKLAYSLFDIDESGHITMKEFCQTIIDIHKDRTILQQAMNDNKTAVNQLNHIVIGILTVLMVVFWLLITEILNTKLLLFLSSQLLVAAFIFGNTCKTIFEAIIFVFVTHPFDIGDRCMIDGIMMVVEEINLLTTVFLKIDKEKVYFPNNVLATKSIGNYYRSPTQGDILKFAIDYKTPLATIQELKERIKQYLEQTDEYWKPDHSLIVYEFERLNAITMGLFFNHTINFQDWKEKTRRRSELVLEMKKIFDELHIQYHLLPQDINLHTMV